MGERSSYASPVTSHKGWEQARGINSGLLRESPEKLYQTGAETGWKEGSGERRACVFLSGSFVLCGLWVPLGVARGWSVLPENYLEKVF